MSQADVIGELTEMWNVGDLEGAFGLYTEDAEIHTGPLWPDPVHAPGWEDRSP